MDFSFSLYPDSLPAFLACVERAEELGAAGIWVDDSGLKRDPYVLLTLASEHSRRISLGTCTTNPLSRHLGVTARAIASLHEASGGRAVLGLGRGEGSLKPLGMRQVSPPELGEAALLLRRLLSGETVDGDQRRAAFRFSNAKLAFFKSQEKSARVPVFIAATGPEMLNVAGRTADGVIVSVGPDPKAIKYALEQIREGAADAGRDFTSLKVMVFLFTSISKDREQARSYARPKALWFLEHAPYLVSLLDVEDSTFKRTLGSAPTTTKGKGLSELLSSGLELGKIVSDQAVDAFTVAGDEEECAQKINRIKQDCGMEHAIFSIRENWEYAASAVARSAH